MTNHGGAYIISSAIGGLIAGAIGAAVAESSDSHPVLKGSLAVGAFNALMATAIYSVLSQPALPATGVSGAGTLQAEWGIR
jgi:hypothetical protein